jgi:methylenetetrahydrofolate reductase (NADPH)
MERKTKHKKSRNKHTPLATLITTAIKTGEFFYSFEYSPARDPNPVDLYARIARMVHDLAPLWIDVTWGFGDIGTRSIAACKHVQKELSIPVLMHFICTDKTTAELERHLLAAKEAGVRAILALRGYTQAGFDKWQPCDEGDGTEPQHADALVRFIKERHGDWFSIGVAGFPEGHPESHGNLTEDLLCLRGKIDAGANFIICQFCFDAAVFSEFVARCRAIGICVPILPGVMPLTEYSTARLLSDTWGVRLPSEIEEKLKECADQDDELGRKYGEDFIVELVNDLTTYGTCGGVHFFVYDAEWEVKNIILKVCGTCGT